MDIAKYNDIFREGKDTNIRDEQNFWCIICFSKYTLLLACLIYKMDLNNNENMFYILYVG